MTCTQSVVMYVTIDQVMNTTYRTTLHDMHSECGYIRDSMDPVMNTTYPTTLHDIRDSVDQVMNTTYPTTGHRKVADGSFGPGSSLICFPTG